MLAGTFINPLNLPNLLTPFRYNLEIQYVVFSIIFVALLGYVLFTFLDYIMPLDKILILLAVFVVLLFLFLVIKERDRLDEYTLQQETVNMEKEIAQIDRDIKLKDLLRKEALKGVIYDENNNRIETGKADLAKVKNFQSEINKLKTRRKELQDKENSYDRLYLDEAREFVKSSTESESAKIIRDNEILAQGIDRISGQSSERLDNLLSEKQRLEDKYYSLSEDEKAKGRKNFEIARASKLNEIRQEKNKLTDKKLTAKERVELDSKRRKLQENVNRQEQIGGLFDRKDNYLLNMGEISKYDSDESQKRQLIKDLENDIRDTNPSDKKRLDRLKKERTKVKDELNTLISGQRDKINSLRRLNRGNEGILKSNKVIDQYDTATDTGAISVRSRQLGALQKLEKKEKIAEKSANLARAAADIEQALISNDKDEKISAIADAVASQVPRASSEEVRQILTDRLSNNPNPNTDVVMKEGIGVFEDYRQKNQGISNTKPARDARKDAFDSVLQKSNYFLRYMAGTRGASIDDDQANAILNSESLLNRTGEEAYRDTLDFNIKPADQKIAQKLRDEIYEDGEMKTKFKDTQAAKKSTLQRNLNTLKYLESKGDLPVNENRVNMRVPLTNNDNLGKFTGQTKTGRNTYVNDLRDLVNQIDDQLEENTSEDLTPEQKRLKKLVSEQKTWLRNRNF